MIIRELVRFALARKKIWLLPILLIMLIVGGLLIFSQGSVLAPFVYAIF